MKEHSNQHRIFGGRSRTAGAALAAGWLLVAILAALPTAWAVSIDTSRVVNNQGSSAQRAVAALETPAAGDAWQSGGSTSNQAETLPSLAEIGLYLAIGMRPGTASEAITIGSANEIGADRAVTTSNDAYGQQHPAERPMTDGTRMFGTSAYNNVFPVLTYANGPMQGNEVAGGPGSSFTSRALAPGSLRSVFIPAPSQGNNAHHNRWFSADPSPSDTGGSNTPNVEYLPYGSNATKQARTFRGVNWSGNLAITSGTGRFSLAGINLFADLGIRTRSSAAASAANIANSYYFADASLTGRLMDSMENAGPNPTLGWTGGVNHTQLLTDLRTWRTYLRNAIAEQTLNLGNGCADLVNRNSINGNGPVVYNVLDTWDIDSNGIIIVNVSDACGGKFEVNNSDWIIGGTGNKLIVFRIRNGDNMQIDNSSIMLGEGWRNAIGVDKLGALFVHIYPEEEFRSTSGSSDAVFQLSNVILNGIGLWDLNTIGDAITDTDYAGYVNRSLQNNYTEIEQDDAQGCSQFISGRVAMQNVRWVRCEPAAPANLDFGDAPDSSAGTGQGNYNTVAAEDGPRHLIIPTLRLGVNAPDADSGTLQNTEATADDTNGADDEDGVAAQPLITTLSTDVSLAINVLNNTGATATLACWIDFNRDGHFVDMGERAATTVAAGALQQTIPLTFSGFAPPIPGPSYLRCRVASAGSDVSNPTGPATTGEIEDHQISIGAVDAGIDYGDAPDPGPGTAEGNYQTRTADNGANHAIVDGLLLGSRMPDLEFGTLHNPAADADDITDFDDEDGIQVLPTISTQSTTIQMSVRATNQTAGTGRLRCWIDFNRDGDFADNGEAATMLQVDANSGTVDYLLTFTGFAPPRTGTTYARCRVGFVANEVALPSGSAYSGEIEDHLLTIQN